MSWVKLDDGLHDNPKALRAGWAAVGLYVSALSYCARHLTDGRVPIDWIARVGAQKLAKRALAADLFTTRPDGDLEIPDYLAFNPSRAEVEARRERAAEAGAKGGAKRSAKPNAKQTARGVASDSLQHPRDGSYTGNAFDVFWSSFPKKKSKADALKAWSKLDPDEDLQRTILTALERAKASKDWQRDGGQFIPYAATWLNGRRWEDEYAEPNGASKDPASGWVEWSVRRFPRHDPAEIERIVRAHYAEGQGAITAQKLSERLEAA